MQRTKTKAKTKKVAWKGLAIVNLCLILMCGAAFGANAFILRADAANYATDELAAEDWYELNSGGNELTVHLPNRFDDYAWKYGMSNDNVRELYSFEIDEGHFDHEVDGEWNVHFAPNTQKDGDVILTFVYVKDADSQAIETRKVKLHIRNGKMVLAG